MNVEETIKIRMSLSVQSMITFKMLILQLAFRSVSTSIQSKRDQIRRILQLPPPATTLEDKEKTKKEQVPKFS